MKNILFTIIALTSCTSQVFGRPKPQIMTIIDAIPSVFNSDFNVSSILPTLPKQCQDAFSIGSTTVTQACSSSQAGDNAAVVAAICSDNCDTVIKSVSTSITNNCLVGALSAVREYFNTVIVQYQVGRSYACAKETTTNAFCILKQLESLNDSSISFNSVADVVSLLYKPAEFFSSKLMCGPCLNVQEVILNNATTLLSEYSAPLKSVQNLLKSCNQTSLVNGSSNLNPNNETKSSSIMKMDSSYSLLHLSMTIGLLFFTLF